MKEASLIEVRQLKAERKKHLDISRIAQIKSAVGIPLTLHGGSATGDDLRKAIVAGITVVHVNTELRVAWKHDLEQGLIKEPNEVVPYKILPFAVESGKSDVLARLNFFNSC